MATLKKNAFQLPKAAPVYLNSMERTTFIQEIKRAVLELEPEATIILYGSRSRGDHTPDSDWDLLVLLDDTVDDRRTDSIRMRLYEIEWEYDEIISSVVRSRQEWGSSLYKIMPIHKRIAQEGVRL